MRTLTSRGHEDKNTPEPCNKRQHENHTAGTTGAPAGNTEADMMNESTKSSGDSEPHRRLDTPSTPLLYQGAQTHYTNREPGYQEPCGSAPRAFKSIRANPKLIIPVISIGVCLAYTIASARFSSRKEDRVQAVNTSEKLACSVICSNYDAQT